MGKREVSQGALHDQENVLQCVFISSFTRTKESFAVWHYVQAQLHHLLERSAGVSITVRVSMLQLHRPMN